jgi:acyl phosphate:glycerol-3-phosphate acyltransferase
LSSSPNDFIGDPGDSMTISPHDVLWTLAGFLAGSIPTAYLVCRRMRGVDIRTLGSGNVGATNVFRTLGRGPGAATLTVDVLKGFIPVLLAARYSPGPAPVLTGLAAVAGHTWTPFLGFRGGKGVATSAGVFLALIPWAASAALSVFVILFMWTGHVSLGSLGAAAVLPAAAFLLYGSRPSCWLALCVCVLVSARHAPNIKRLLKGEEHGFKKKA